MLSASIHLWHEIDFDENYKRNPDHPFWKGPAHLLKHAAILFILASYQHLGIRFLLRHQTLHRAGGILGGRRNKPGEAGSVEIYFSNPDQLFSNEFPTNRFGQGSLAIALKALLIEVPLHSSLPCGVKHKICCFSVDVGKLDLHGEHLTTQHWCVSNRNSIICQMDLHKSLKTRCT